MRATTDLVLKVPMVTLYVVRIACKLACAYPQAAAQRAANALPFDTVIPVLQTEFADKLRTVGTKNKIAALASKLHEAAQKEMETKYTVVRDSLGDVHLLANASFGIC